jgi:hypothetical protein
MIISRTAVSFAAIVSVCANGALAQPARLDTAENIAAAIQACVVITSANDYNADGQSVDIAWTKATERVSSFGLQDDPTTLTANVWSSETSHNSFCDFVFDDADLTQAAYDMFMQDNVAVFFDDQNGICFDNTFIAVEASGPDGPMAQAMNAQGHISVYNTPQYGDDPCRP